MTHIDVLAYRLIALMLNADGSVNVDGARGMVFTDKAEAEAVFERAEQLLERAYGGRS